MIPEIKQARIPPGSFCKKYKEPEENTEEEEGEGKEKEGEEGGGGEGSYYPICAFLVVLFFFPYKRMALFILVKTDIKGFIITYFININRALPCDSHWSWPFPPVLVLRVDLFSE